jgi:septal ring factor EnvC (AmiA/AmiB activator)
VTQQGVTGLKSQIAGPKRKVFDKSYYVQAFKKKNERLTEEIAKLRQKKEKRKEEEAVRGKLLERKKELHKEVRGFEAKLADFNLAMDKHRAGTHKGDLVIDWVFYYG